MVGVTQVLNKHAPIISRKAKRQSDEWLSDSYRMARSLKRQFERMWRKHKTQFNSSRLRKQIAWCSRLANKDKGSYYPNLITANSDDPKKLWQSLRKVLHRTSYTVLPAHSSDKSLADMFASFFSNKISKIRDMFSTSGSSMMHLIRCLLLSIPLCLLLKMRSISVLVNPLLNLAHWTLYQHSSLKIVLISSSHLLPKLVNYTLIEDSFPNSFKKPVVTPLIKKAFSSHITHQ